MCAGYSRWQGGIGGYDKDVCWLAQWREGLSYFAYDTLLSEFFAAVLDGSGSEADAVYGILRDSVEGIGPVPGDPRGAYRAFMSCSRTDAWEFTEQLLLAAQREEGLRQSLVESAIRGHPGLLKRVFEGSFVKTTFQGSLRLFARSIIGWVMVGILHLQERLMISSSKSKGCYLTRTRRSKR